MRNSTQSLSIEISTDKYKRLIINGNPTNIAFNNPVTSVPFAVQQYLVNTLSSLNGTYHKDIYWPTEVELSVKLALAQNFNVDATSHLRSKLFQNDLPENIYKRALLGEVVEAYFANGILYKVLTRQTDPKHPDTDICFIVSLNSNGVQSIASVITVWLNTADDKHETLNEENYVRPQGDKKNVVTDKTNAESETVPPTEKKWAHTRPPYIRTKGASRIQHDREESHRSLCS